jgi:hypothetical protein
VRWGRSKVFFGLEIVYIALLISCCLSAARMTLDVVDVEASHL